MTAPRIIVSNDDGIAADGLHALTKAIAALRTPSVVVAPSQDRSGVARLASYSQPVVLEPLAEAHGIPHYVCHGSPVDCIRSAVLGELAPQAELVVSGINHGPNLGDDLLNSGTVAAASEGALLGLQGLAISQQYFDDHFHILDSLNPITPIYDATAEVGAMVAAAMLERPGPERTVLNVNVPANIRDRRVALTRPGRRFYEPGSLRPVERGGVRGYLTYGERDGPPPPFEDAAGTDFAALRAYRVSITPLSFAWHEECREREATTWAAEICSDVELRMNGVRP